MKSVLLILITLCYSLIAQSAMQKKEVKGSRNVQTEQRSTEKFTKLSVSQKIRVFLTQGENPALTVKADDNLLPYIKTEVKGDQLKIYISENIQIHSCEKMEVYVTTPLIQDIRVTTSAYLKTTAPFSVKNIKVLSNTSGEIDMNLEALSIDLSATTSGEIILEGKANALNVSVTTSGIVNAEKLQAENANIKISTSGTAHINVSTKLSYSVTTSGELSYMGHPELIKTNVNTSGSVRNKSSF